MAAKKPRKVGLEIGVSLGLGLAFAVGLGVYLNSTIPSAEELKGNMQMLVPSAQQPGPGLHEGIAGVGQRFITALKQGQYEAAYALTTKGYRAARTLEQFTATCKESPYLATAQEINFVRTSQTTVKLESGETVPSTALARGMLVSKHGTVDTSIALAPEDGEFRILTILAAGVAIFQAVKLPATPAPNATAAPAGSAQAPQPL